MGKKNLKAQLNYVVKSCFQGNDRQNGGYGSSKHSDKVTGQKNGKIYSWSSFHARQDTACQFAGFVRENYPDVKEAKQLTPEMAEAFLLSKAATCTTETLDCYRSNLASLGENINRTYSSAHVSLAVSKVVGTNAGQESRCKAMSDKHIAMLQDSYRPGTTGHTAVTLAAATGCRASELVRLKNENIEIKNSNFATVFVKSGKGGRDRTIQITEPSAVASLSIIKSSTAPGATVLSCKAGSVQKSINRHLSKLKDEDGNSLKAQYSHTSVHAIRKNWAQKEYDRYRENHTRQESLDYVSAQLGHGDDRDLATLQRYIANIY